MTFLFFVVLAPLNRFSILHGKSWKCWFCSYFNIGIDQKDSKVLLYVVFLWSWIYFTHYLSFLRVSIYNLSIFPDSTVCECFKFFLPRLIFRWNLPVSLWQIVFLQFPEILKKNEHFWYSLREKWVSLKVFRVSWCFIKNKKKTKSCSIKT